jgi:hypothetical protein
MATPMGFELLKQLFKKPATNVFPVTYYPDSILKLLEKNQLPMYFRLLITLIRY